MNKISDPILLGGFAGAVGSIVKETIARNLFVKTGIAPFDGIEKGAGMLIQSYEVRTIKGNLIGILMDSTLGAGLGAVLAILHKKRVVNINACNGTLIGMSMWATLYGALGGISSFQRTTPNGALATAVWHLMYGAITGGLISALVEQDSTPKSLNEISNCGCSGHGSEGPSAVLNSSSVSTRRPSKEAHSGHIRPSGVTTHSRS